MEKQEYVYKVKMTYKSLDVTVWQLLSIVASTKQEAIAKAHKRWENWQKDITQYEVLYKWDWESAKAIGMLSARAELYVYTYQ